MKALAFNMPAGWCYRQFRRVSLGITRCAACRTVHWVALGLVFLLKVLQHIAPLSPVSCIIGVGTSKWTNPPA